MSNDQVVRDRVSGVVAVLLIVSTSVLADMVTVSPKADGGVAGELLEPPPCASASLAQAAWDGPNITGVGCNPYSSAGSSSIGMARAFTMPVGSAFAIHCVNAVIATNTSEFTTTANIWLGTPGTPTSELILLASRTVTIPEIFFDAGGVLAIDFTDEVEVPQIPAGATAMIEISVPTRDLKQGGVGGQSTILTNLAPASGPTYVRAVECTLPDFVDLDPYLPGRQVVLRVDGEWVPAVSCIGDFDGSGVVDGADLGILLNGWGSAGITDLNGDGVTDGADLGSFLTAWGTCQR